MIQHHRRVPLYNMGMKAQRTGLCRTDPIPGGNGQLSVEVDVLVATRDIRSGRVPRKGVGVAGLMVPAISPEGRLVGSFSPRLVVDMHVVVC